MGPFNDKIDSASMIINSSACRSIKKEVLDLIDYIKKTSSMRVIALWDTVPELDKLIYIVTEFYSLANLYENLKQETEDNSEEKEREIFKKYFNQIIDNLLDGNTDWKHKKNL